MRNLKIKLIDEVIFFIGLLVSIIGFSIKNYILLLIGIIISLFSAVLLHYALRQRVKVENVREINVQEIKPIKEKIESPVLMIETDIDKVHSIVSRYGSIALKDIAVILKADIKRVEELARILDKYKIAELYYPAVGTALLRNIKK